jgi:hypothetical protein
MGETRSRVAQLKDDALGLIREAVEAQYREQPDAAAAEPRRRSKGAAMAAQLAQRAAAQQRAARVLIVAEPTAECG